MLQTGNQKVRSFLCGIEFCAFMQFGCVKIPEPLCDTRPLNFPYAHIRCPFQFFHPIHISRIYIGSILVDKQVYFAVIAI